MSNEESTDSEDECGDTSLEDKLLLADRDKIYEILVRSVSIYIALHIHFNLVIKDDFKQAGSINKLLSKVSAIVSHVTRSIHAAKVLESERRLKATTVTRWNSQPSMIQSILRISEELSRHSPTDHLQSEALRGPY